MSDILPQRAKTKSLHLVESDQQPNSPMWECLDNDGESTIYVMTITDETHVKISVSPHEPTRIWVLGRSELDGQARLRLAAALISSGWPTS